ncbi:hypothetical protein CPT03_14600 [Pedobacter ginsengisoli]|uniref:Uncharacterized protein n=1 Tax=Pedobacter ginsengisoli TaxID=363852 RepID=A0A2D1U7N5_9SPHI|nr:hypothetical protein [Pedobacter ginsengisoli]ATP57616.1 hypothetical protein CPT03_14600 [Pedobacter ginsengisoli]
MNGLINALKAIVALILIGTGWYSLGYGFTSTNGDGNFFFIGGFILGGLGVTILIHLIAYAKY